MKSYSFPFYGNINLNVSKASVITYLIGIFIITLISLLLGIIGSVFYFLYVCLDFFEFNFKKTKITQAQTEEGYAITAPVSFAAVKELESEV
jgi:hypothetical protein